MFNNNTHRIQAVNSFIAKVYAWMFIALSATALTAYIVHTNPALMYMIYSWLILLVPIQIGLLIYMQVALRKISYTTATMLFVLYSILMGATLAPIFVLYTMHSIIHVFTITAGMFGVTALYGYYTQKDLSRYGSLLMMCLFGLLIAQVINMFMGSAQFDYITSIFGVILFVGLTAYDMQKIKAVAYELDVTYDEDQDALANKLALVGASILYLDFLNLFLKLLRIMGKRRK